MKKNISIIILFIGLVAWQCSKFDQKADLKQSLMSGVNDVNTALSSISFSRGYDLLTINGDGSGMGFSTETGTDVSSVVAWDITDSITLDKVAGIYNFQPDYSRFWHRYFPVSLFKKTGESDHMIVHMPQRLMFRPKYLFNMNVPDTSLKNDFTIDASAYHLFRNGWNSFDYNLEAAFTVRDTAIGESNINYLTDPEDGISFDSEFTFPLGYKITVEKSAVDTIRSSSFALLDDNDDILLKETSVVAKTGYKMHEKTYILTIGNIDIKRSTGVDSIQVYLNGTLQKKAAVKIMDEKEDNDNKSICHSRDLQITFDDGTTTNLSDLINPALVTLRTLVGALGEMYFARNIVDYIALSIAYSAH